MTGDLGKRRKRPSSEGWLYNAVLTRNHCDKTFSSVGKSKGSALHGLSRGNEPFLILRLFLNDSITIVTEMLSFYRPPDIRSLIQEWYKDLHSASLLRFGFFDKRLLAHDDDYT